MMKLAIISMALLVGPIFTSPVKVRGKLIHDSEIVGPRETSDMRRGDVGSLDSAEAQDPYGTKLAKRTWDLLSIKEVENNEHKEMQDPYGTGKLVKRPWETSSVNNGEGWSSAPFVKGGEAVRTKLSKRVDNIMGNALPQDGPPEFVKRLMSASSLKEPRARKNIRARVDTSDGWQGDAQVLPISKPEKATMVEYRARDNRQRSNTILELNEVGSTGARKRTEDKAGS